MSKSRPRVASRLARTLLEQQLQPLESVADVTNRIFWFRWARYPDYDADDVDQTVSGPVGLSLKTLTS